MLRFLKTYLAAKKSRPAVRAAQFSSRPSLETLEDRLALSTVGGSGSSVLIVNNTADNWGAGTLRSAVSQANWDAAHGISDKIVFANNLRQVTVNLTQGALEIQPLHGNGPGTTIDGGNTVTLTTGGRASVFQVDAHAELNLYNLTIKNGSAWRGGGAVNNGTLNVFSCNFVNDHAGTQGGAIYNTGTLNLNASIFVNNSAGTEGGAVFNLGTLSANNSNFSSNFSNGWGGAVSDWGTGTFNSDYFWQNSASHGGGALVIGANTTLTGMNVFDTNSADNGGAIEIGPHGNLNDPYYQSHTTYQYNSAHVHGGAIYVDHGNGHNATIGGRYIRNTSPQNDQQWWA